jgi:hypothetical protein
MADEVPNKTEVFNLPKFADEAEARKFLLDDKPSATEAEYRQALDEGNMPPKAAAFLQDELQTAQARRMLRRQSALEVLKSKAQERSAALDRSNTIALAKKNMLDPITAKWNELKASLFGQDTPDLPQ